MVPSNGRNAVATLRPVGVTGVIYRVIKWWSPRVRLFLEFFFFSLFFSRLFVTRTLHHCCLPWRQIYRRGCPNLYSSYRSIDTTYDHLRIWDCNISHIGRFIIVPGLFRLGFGLTTLLRNSGVSPSFFPARVETPRSPVLSCIVTVKDPSHTTPSTLFHLFIPLSLSSSLSPPYSTTSLLPSPLSNELFTKCRC